ncbi:pilus assembly protein [Allosphingosinicella indica]|uniref:Flp pilus assembly protein TadG n=1 Tax=Allosphingosinicella indica TaxID=941907 RepID=A0A1X7GQU3_9SPHN|nr:TadE/TadG family type IV pilus assembly protein [Allosphingosinicella indica]SMF73223.1 Flp pilus assembly protein TadG [Allosphingosinicella indica]
MIFRFRSKTRDTAVPRDGKPQHRGVLRRLLKDPAGNTLVIVGAALVPLTAMIGSGVDLSRAYMARTRLQSACDAASLAARRVMTADTMSQGVRDEANRFFNFNFPQGLYDTAPFTPNITRPDQGRIHVTAATTIPTVIMRMFGFETLPLSVECEASQNFVNTDILLVLDVTGSMDETLSGTKKIVSLRDAVMALYDELRPVQTELELNGMRLRYGIVPYSSAVNVGRLIRDANSGYLANSAPYQSRTPLYVQSTSTENVTNQTSNQCNARAVTPSGNNVTLPLTEKSVSRSGTTCTVTTRTLGRPITSTFSGYWLHEQRTLDVSSFKTFSNSVPLPTRTPNTTQNATVWNGCIEERQSANTITSASGYAVPPSAYDLNVDYIPNSDATRWKPHWPEVVYNRSAGSTDSLSGTAIVSRGEPYYACPTEARRLQAFTRAQMQSYVNLLAPIGGTYHDIGMIWGARLISAGGIFADSPNTFNGMPVAKHLIFMTDGALAPNADTYTSYGVENLDNRVGSYASPEQKNRHNQRFKMICNTAKGMNVSIWVIAFDAAADANLTECASAPNQVSVSSNRQQLIDRFTEIGKNIGALRLTQ